MRQSNILMRQSNTLLLLPPLNCAAIGFVLACSELKPLEVPMVANTKTTTYLNGTIKLLSISIRKIRIRN